LIGDGWDAPTPTGLCAYVPGAGAGAPAWQLAGLSAPDGGGSAATPYGRFTGETLPTGGGALPARAPRYVIELLPLVRAGEDAGQRAQGLYRITAIGFGARPGTQAAAAFYRKVPLRPGGMHNRRRAPPACCRGSACRRRAAAGRARHAGGMAAHGRAGGRRARRSPSSGAGLLVSPFEPDGASGRLEQRALVTSIGGALSIGATPIWEAGALLTGDPAKPLPARPAPQERKIYTLARRPGQPDSTLAFELSNLASEERAWLDLAPPNGAPDGLGEARVVCCAATRTREIGQPDGVFRRRASVLGDTIGSTPLLVRAPSASIAGPGYAAFHAFYKGRANAVYLGANDGMLHAFDARDGAELFAYVPRALLPALNQLTYPKYSHRAYVDASAGQGEASAGGQWRSVLVSGMGMGARGVFALDITDPAAFGAGPGALWEFTGQDDTAIGHVGSAPLIARLKVGSAGGLARYRDFALVPSGINNYGRMAIRTVRCLLALTSRRPRSGRRARTTTGWRRWLPIRRWPMHWPRRRLRSRPMAARAMPTPATCRARCGASTLPASRRFRVRRCSQRATPAGAASRSPMRRAWCSRRAAATWSCSAPES
jgi:type IV pilus assembly protein PilY1